MTIGIIIYVRDTLLSRFESPLQTLYIVWGIQDYCAHARTHDTQNMLTSAGS